MWEKIQADLEGELTSAIAQNGGLRPYLWTFDGEISGRGPGWGWHIQLHLEDAAQEGGVKHVSIGSGPILSHELSENLKAWFLGAAQRLPGKLSPRIDVAVNC